MIEASIGGLLIGTSALLLMYFFGRIAGISDIFFASVENIKKPQTNFSSFIFIVGLMIGASLYYAFTKQSFPSPENSYPLAIIAGLLVGFGARIGSGCTSGHGVCGISRFSIRSLSSTIVFIFFGMLTVGIVRHVI
jgi:uncharacterized membrane protein YedE/YeeE